MDTEILFSIAVAGAILAIVAIGEIFVFLKNKKYKHDLEKQKEDINHKMYEISILKELNDKMGYSLGAQNVVEIIKKSLPDIIDYRAISYMLFLPEKIIFRSYVEKPVSRKYMNDIKEKMLGYSSQILNANLKGVKVEEKFWGDVVEDISQENAKANEVVGSFFNIPLKISGKFAGVLNISDTRVNFFKGKDIGTVNEIVTQATNAVTGLQEVIELEKSKLNAMVFSMTDGVIMTDIDFRILVANPAIKKALGLEGKEELSINDLAQSLGGKIDLKDKIEESVRLEKIFLSDEIALGENFFKIIVSPVKDRWKLLGSVVVFRDITKEKEVQRLKEDFTSMIVHELRSPLDAIKKMTELMRVSKVTKEKREQCLQMMYGSSSDMLELISNLLDIAKIEAGKFQLMKQKSDIKKIIESRIMFFDIGAKDVGVKLSSCLGQNIPEDVEFDPRTISQVLNNFLSNALKFTKENGSVTVQALLHKAGGNLQAEAKDAGINWFIKKDMAEVADSLVVAVTDSGIGIAPDQIGKLFNKFIQAKTTFVQKGGTGLGLAISKSIVESHGGIVGAESVEGQGTTFYFTIPININS